MGNPMPTDMEETIMNNIDNNSSMTIEAGGQGNGGHPTDSSLNTNKSSLNKSIIGDR